MELTQLFDLKLRPGTLNCLFYQLTLQKRLAKIFQPKISLPENFLAKKDPYCQFQNQKRLLTSVSLK